MVTVEALAFGYKRKRRLFSDLQLHLEPGGIYGLLGKNGAGKTTLLKLLCGLRFPQAGSCRVAAYLVMQTIFLLGSVYFRRLAFLKTLGMLSLLAAVVVAVGLIVVRIVLRDHLTFAREGAGWSIRPDTAIGGVSGGWASGGIPLTPGLDAFVKVLRILFWAAVAPVAWVIAYLRMREKEA